MKLLPLAAILALASCSPTPPAGPRQSSNDSVVAAIRSMPHGKGYEASQKAVDRLAANVSLKGSRFEQDFKGIGPTFCSGATYLVFLKSIEQYALPKKALALLADLDAKDGEKVFGRWNANGPGTAKLFADLGCGVNFTSFESARPGDFLKLWWTEAIGGKERGHLVVYLGHNDQEVTFWSANEPGGYGRKSVRRKQIKHHLFSRLTRPSRLPRVTRLSSSDPFLADMLRRDFTWSQVVRECRVSNTP